MTLWNLYIVVKEQENKDIEKVVGVSNQDVVASMLEFVNAPGEYQTENKPFLDRIRPAKNDDEALRIVRRYLREKEYDKAAFIAEGLDQIQQGSCKRLQLISGV